MKNSSKIILLLLMFQAGWVGAQDQEKLKRYSAGLRIANFYDLPSDKFDSELSIDPKGLNGENTSFDLGMDLYGEVMLNPLLGFQAGLRFGGTSGSNEVEYYDNSFYEVYSDMILLLSNIDKGHATKLFNYYAKFGLGYGGYKAERYLMSDNSFNGSTSNGFWDGHVGAGVQYELNPYLRLELDVSYNVVFDDGFDGFNYGTGNDPYLSTGIGVAYTFGNREEERPMYSVGLSSMAYTGPDEQDSHIIAEKDELEKQVTELNQNLKDLNAKFQTLSNQMQQQKASLEKQSERIEKQEKLILDLKAASVDTLAMATEPVTIWQKELQQVQVYFEFDSDALTPETQIILTSALKEDFDQVTLVGYASNEGSRTYNDQLKMRRVNRVKDYLLTKLSFDSGKVVETTSGEVEDLKEDNYLNRKVVVKY